MSEPTVAVTGAAGFVGRHVVDTQANAGHRVRAWVRKASGRWAGDTHVQEIETGDLASFLDFEQLLTGVTHLVHLATTDQGDDAEQRAIHIDVTRRLMDAAERTGLKCFVFTSSVRAVAGESHPEVLTPESEPSPEEPYGRLKLEAERMLLNAVSPPQTMVLRLPMVYGPGAGANFNRLVRWVASGRPVPVGWQPNRRSLLYIGNLTEVVRRIVSGEIEDSGWGSGLYQLADPQPVSTEEMITQIARGAAQRPRTIRVPAVAGSLLSAAPVAGRYFRRLLGSLEMAVPPMFDDLPFTTAEGMERTVREILDAQALT